MKMRTGEELLTLKDLAERASLDRSHQGITRTLRQARHWTQCDVLETISEKSTGKGVPRLYAKEPTLEILAILLELNRYGATVDILKPVAEDLYDQFRGSGGPYLSSATTDSRTYMRVSWSTDPESGNFVNPKIDFFDEMDDPDVWELPIDRSSWVTIYMNGVLARIDLS